MGLPVFIPSYGMVVSPVQIHMAFTASFMKLAATPLLKPFPEPSRIISIKIPQATENPVRNVRILFFFMVAKISCHISISNIVYSLSGFQSFDVAFLELFKFSITDNFMNQSVFQSDNLVSHGCNIMLVCDNDYRDSGFINLFQNIHYFIRSC